MHIWRLDSYPPVLLIRSLYNGEGEQRSDKDIWDCSKFQHIQMRNCCVLSHGDIGRFDNLSHVVKRISIRAKLGFD